MQTKCLFCGHPVRLIRVHGHYQCPCCKINALPCCDGDNCDNLFLNDITSVNKDPGKPKAIAIHVKNNQVTFRGNNIAGN